MKELCLGHVPYGTGVVKPFDVLFPKNMMVTPKSIHAGAVDALIIWGGADISPSIYDEPVGPHTGAGEALSKRDEVEVGVINAAIANGIPIIGVCRGAQLLCALAGGKLHQHVTGHMGDHGIITDEGIEYVTSSIHHQMMDVTTLLPENYKMIAWSKLNLSTEVTQTVEPEIVYFPKIKGLAIQGHPEFMHPDCDFVDYCRKLVQEYLL